MNSQMVETSSVPPNGKLPAGVDNTEDTVAEPFVSSGKKAVGAAAGSKGIILFAVGAGLVVLFLLVIGLSTTKTKKRANNDPPKVNLGQQAQSSEAPKRITPTDQLAPERQGDDDAVTAADITRTKNAMRTFGEQVTSAATSEKPSAIVGNARADRSVPSAGVAGGSSVGKPLATIPPFQQPTINTQWSPQPYTGQPYTGQPYQAQPAPGGGQQASAQELIRLAKEEVTKPSMVFTLRRQQAVTQAAGAGPAITNFGLEPGFHVAVRLEASASTAVAAPVTAVVEYNYQRNGEILIPAGSRAIGKIDGADRNGNVSMSFSTIDLPDGTPIPISAVAVDSNLRTIKGVVTGSNRGKGIIVGTLSGIGQAAAMLVGQSSSSMSAPYSQADLMRDRLAQNTGQMGDAQIQRMIANERIVVTVPAGTELYMVFTKPAVAAKSTTTSASSMPVPNSGINGRVALPGNGNVAPPLGSGYAAQ